MTMDDLKAMTCDFISARQAASVIHMDPGRLVQYAKEGRTPFPVQISGNRVKIPRLAFLRCYGYESEPEKKLAMEDLMQKMVDELHTLNLVMMGILLKIDPDAAITIRSEGTPQ